MYHATRYVVPSGRSRPNARTSGRCHPGGRNLSGLSRVLREDGHIRAASIRRDRSGALLLVIASRNIFGREEWDLPVQFARIDARLAFTRFAPLVTTASPEASAMCRRREQRVEKGPLQRKMRGWLGLLWGARCGHGATTRSALRLEPSSGRSPSLPLRRDVVAVEQVVLDPLDLNLGKPSLGQHLPGFLLAPHRPKSRSLKRQRHGHAMHARNRVHHWG